MARRPLHLSDERRVALRRALKAPGMSTIAIMSWTNPGERTVKGWLSGRSVSKPVSLQADEIVCVRVPFSIRRRGGRKMVVVPAAATAAPARAQVDSAMVKALARAFRWRKLL